MALGRIRSRGISLSTFPRPSALCLLVLHFVLRVCISLSGTMRKKDFKTHNKTVYGIGFLAQLFVISDVSPERTNTHTHIYVCTRTATQAEHTHAQRQRSKWLSTRQQQQQRDTFSFGTACVCQAELFVLLHMRCTMQ